MIFFTYYSTIWRTSLKLIFLLDVNLILGLLDVDLILGPSLRFLGPASGTAGNGGLLGKLGNAKVENNIL